MSVILSTAHKNANGQPPNGRGNRPIGGCLPWSCAGAVHSVPPDGGSPRADGRSVDISDLSGVAQRRQNHPEVQRVRQRRTVCRRFLLGGHRLSRRYGVPAHYPKTTVPNSRPGQRLRTAEISHAAILSSNLSFILFRQRFPILPSCV